MNNIIMFSGVNGSGKTFAARYLEKKYNLKRLSFATEIKDLFCKIYSVNREELENNKSIFRFQWSLNDIQNQNIKNRLSNFIKPDEINAGLVELGRLYRSFDEDYWVKKLFENNLKYFVKNSKSVIIDDLRFPNEVKYISKNSQLKPVYTIRIQPELKELTQRGYKLHDDYSEVSMNNYKFNYYIKNTYNGGFVDEVERIYRSIE